MWYTIWYALGIFTGIYITSIRFRIRINRSYNGFVLWVRRLMERRRTIKKLRTEIKRLRGIADSVSYKKKLKY
jgi:hypothetical protein